MHYVRPGAAWLQYGYRWYLVTSRDGCVTDAELGKAIYLVDRFEAVEGETAGAGTFFFAFRVRHVLFDPAARAIRLSCDLLIRREEPAGVDGVLERVVRGVLERVPRRDDWAEEVVYEVAVDRADLTAPSTGEPSLEGDSWFERFLGRGP